MTPKEKIPQALVIDASVVLAFYLPAEPYKEKALALLEEGACGNLKLLVPTLARYEILNALSLAVRGLKTEQILFEEALEIMRAVNALHLEERHIAGLEEKILKLSQEHQCTAYDAAYLALAVQERTPFVTGDLRLFNVVKDRLPLVHWIGNYPETSQRRTDFFT